MGVCARPRTDALVDELIRKFKEIPSGKMDPRLISSTSELKERLVGITVVRAMVDRKTILAEKGISLFRRFAVAERICALRSGGIGLSV